MYERVFVTGATGFVGRQLVAELRAAGSTVVAWHRPGTDAVAALGPSGTGLLTASGDLCDRGTLVAAMAGCDAVVHLAAHMGHHPGERAAQWRVNVHGTAAVLAAARGRRVVHVSSVATLGGPGPCPVALDEDAGFDWPPEYQYAHSKEAGERLARDAGAVVVNPATIYGPGRAGASARRVRRYLDLARLAGCPPGCDTVVDVADVTAGIHAALARGEPGRRYILGGDVVAFSDFLAEAATLLGERGPRRRLAPAVAEALARCVAWAERLGVDPGVSSHAARLAVLERRYSSARARLELGYAWRPFREVLRRAVAGGA